MSTCFGFTAIVMVITVLPVVDMSDMSKPILQQLFFMALTIAIVMFIAEKIEKKLDVSSLLVDALIRVLICYLVVFVEGGLVGMFPFEWKVLVGISPILLPVFIITYALSYLTNVNYVKGINRLIKRRK